MADTTSAATPASTPSFDFIVVGAGSAGCVLANRLSADPAVSVCLLEAGPRDSSPLIHVPLGMAGLINHPVLNWRYGSVPQPRAAARSVYVPRGKVLGGTSAINGMVYMRGHPGDYDDWADAGNAGWAWKDVLPYFRKSENNEIWRDSPLHGVGGPLNVTDLRTRNPVAQTFVDAARSIGLPACDDFNGPQPEGVGFRQVTQRNGRRESAATAYLAPVRSRPNLRVVTGALVDRIVFDGTRARGVRFLLDGQWCEWTARAEVILAAGAIASPQILLRSGVGDRGHLDSMGVRPVAHVPGVGGNLQDHAAVSVACETRSTAPYGISLAALPRLAWSLVDYALFRKGLLSSNVLEAAAYVRTDATPAQPGSVLARPDIQFSFMSARRGAARKGSPSTQLGWGHGYGLTAILLRPGSRGTVRLASPDPSAAPLIDPCFFSDERDMDVLLRGLQLGRRILNAPAFSRYQGKELTPGAEVQDTQALRDFIRNTSGTAFHPVGTCAMGQGEASVVDEKLRVRGVQRLRVVDASVMPTIVGGNTNAPTIMIAEKAADMIRFS